GTGARAPRSVSPGRTAPRSRRAPAAGPRWPSARGGRAPPRACRATRRCAAPPCARDRGRRTPGAGRSRRSDRSPRDRAAASRWSARSGPRRAAGRSPPRVTAPVLSHEKTRGPDASTGMQETTPIPLRPPPARPVEGEAEGARPKRKLKKLRLVLVFAVLLFLAVLSTIFGMMMAVSKELPKLEDKAQFRAARNSRLLSDGGKHSIA